MYRLWKFDTLTLTKTISGYTTDDYSNLSYLISAFRKMGTWSKGCQKVAAGM